MSKENEPTFADFELPIFDSDTLASLQPEQTIEPISKPSFDDNTSGLVSDFCPKKPAVAPPPEEPPLGKPVAWLLVVRGEKVGECYPLYQGKNVIGRTSTSARCVNLIGQEAPERIWTSRQHAIIHVEGSQTFIEDLKSLNGTFVNRVRVQPGNKILLNPSEVIQVGTVQLRFIHGESIPKV